MTIRELLENAHLDALGLLDGEEAAAFERAYAAAPQGIKSQVRAEQARWAGSPSLMVDAEPSPDLRGRVLRAVHAAIVQSESGSGADLELRPSRRVASWWRATSVGLLCTCVLLSAAFLKVMDEYGNLAEQIPSNSVMNDWMGAARTGGNVLSDTLFSEQTTRVLFSPSEAAMRSGFPGVAAVFVNPGWQRFYCENLPQNEGKVYRLVVLKADRSIDRTIQDLPAQRGFQTVGLNELNAGTTLAVVAITANMAFDPATDIFLTATL